MTPTWFAATLNPALDTALGLDPEARARVQRLQGAVLGIHVTGLEWLLYAVPEEERVRLQAQDPLEAPSAWISGPPASLAMLATREGTRALFSGQLYVAGDVAVAKAYKRLFDTLDPDWEEALASAVGDIPAHEAGRVMRGLRAWARRAVLHRREDLRAWLIDEVEIVPTRAEADRWLAEVDRLRADADRLAARLARLERADDRG
ncbi:MAG: SCP2 sterol-binding domain-containing protein [Halofilum sp. (in: g-proteobacteria)]